MTPKITVDKNYIIIDGHQIPRTHLCSQDQWIKFWAKVAPKKPDTGETMLIRLPHTNDGVY